MPGTALPTEITVLAWSVGLVFVQILLQSGLATLQTGLTYNASARDSDRQPDGKYAGRAKRALSNLLETYPIFVGLALALTATGRAGGIGAQGALIWIVARAVYVPLYMAGVPYLRTIVFGVSIWGLVRMLEQLIP